MTTDRLGQVQELVARSQGAIADAVELLAKYGSDLAVEPPNDLTTAHKIIVDRSIADLTTFRRALLDLLELSLPDEVRDRLKGAFTAVGIAEPEDRRALAEMVADRPILSLADLTIPEAERLFVEIRKQEEPF
jgi:hypothetical protein